MGNCLGVFLGEDNRSAPQISKEEILFFPDERMPCRYYAAHGHCSRSNCGYAHEKTNLSRLVEILEAASTSIELCIFALTCNELANALEEAHEKRRVKVRIVADSEQSHAQGADVVRLAGKGIEVRIDEKPSGGYKHMHHKFCVVDNRTLITGSFNWTRQAVLSNNENVFITSSPYATKLYSAEFEKLWRQYEKSRLK